MNTEILTAENAKGPKMPTVSYYQPLFDHMSREHGLILLESEMNDICEIVRAHYIRPKKQPRILHLTLKKKWFDMVASGEKKEEYRKQSDWMFSRLDGKEYDLVRFRNGYSPTSPVLECKYMGWRLGFGKPQWGGKTEGGDRIVVILLGRVISKTP